MNHYPTPSTIIGGDSYDDIIDLEPPCPRHPRMPDDIRAAQFAPFAALSSLDDSLRATAEGINHPLRMSDFGGKKSVYF